MTRPIYTTARLAAICALAIITAYLFAMRSNITPHGADKARWESTTTGYRVDVPATRVDNPDKLPVGP